MPAQRVATAIVKKLSEAGHIAYFAGGWVRDFLMKTPSDDIDIATTASVEEVQALFLKTVPVGISFGIVVVVEEGFSFEVATFRKDQGYVDGRRPLSVEPTTPKEDALRRDFTINGMFYDPLKERLYDYVGGQEDIQKKVIRAIGDPHERFLEDRLRMMRAIRYATRFGFAIDLATEKAIVDHAATLFPSVAIERVWQEFKKMSRFAHFDEGLIALHRLGLLPTIFPDLKEVSLKEIVRRLRPLKEYPTPCPPIAELIELFPGSSLEKLLSLCDFMKLSKEEREFVSYFHHAKEMFRMPADWQQKLEPIEWAHFYARPYSPLCVTIFLAHVSEEEKALFKKQHEERMEQLAPFIKRIQERRPVVKAEHLQKEGISSGVAMGKLLKEAERISVNTPSEDPAEVICLLRKSSLWHSSSKK